MYEGVTTDAGVVASIEVAYRHAYEELWHDVFRFALAWTNDWSAAEDLAQESYLRLWDHRHRVDWERPLRPWLLVTVRRLATDRFRALRRRRPMAPRATQTDEALIVRWLDVQRSMVSLSALERGALVLTAIDGLSYAEAALVVGTSAGALRAAVSRARDKLEVA